MLSLCRPELMRETVIAKPRAVTGSPFGACRRSSSSNFASAFSATEFLLTFFGPMRCLIDNLIEMSLAAINGIPARTSISRSFTTSASRWSIWKLRDKSRWTSPITFNGVMPSACCAVLSCFLDCCSDLLGNRGFYHISFSSGVR